MKMLAPSYYKNFRCIADKCTHSCCVGWEIDIDDDTYENYRNEPGEFGERLRKSISLADDVAYFTTDSEGRCPFLNKSNLCDIILNMGEESLCQICDDHPRFYNYYNDRTEVGLGLCCEAAGQLILGWNSPFTMVELWDDDITDTPNEREIEFLDFRRKLFKITGNNALTKDEKIKGIFECIDSPVPFFDGKSCEDLLLPLERLDEKWTDYLNKLSRVKSDESPLPEWVDKAYMRAMEYFLYRHLTDGIFDNSILRRVKFAYFSCYIIELLCKIHIRENNSLTLSDLVEYARLYSGEIEYSTDNVKILLDKI